MSETQHSIINKVEGVKAGKLDLNALADAFEARGDISEAKRYRDLAQRQPELERKSNAEVIAHWDKKQQEERQNQPDMRPLQPNERADAVQIPRAEFEKKIRAKVEEMLQVKTKPQAPK